MSNPPERKRINVVITETNNMLDIIIVGSIGNIPKGSRILYRLEFIAVRGLPYSAITGSALRDLEGVTADNHGLHKFKRSEYEQITAVLLRICRGLSIDSLVVEEGNRPLIEIVEKNGNLSPIT